MNVMISGGGTGGHIYPALAFARYIRRLHPEASIVYVGSEDGLEADIVPREGLQLETVKISGFKRKLSAHNVRTVVRFVKAVKQARRYIRTHQPDVVIGTGGYVAGPVVYAAAKEGVPSIVHEQNSVPGLTNKFLSRYADRIALSFEEASSYFPGKETMLTGNPRASEVLKARGASPLPDLGLSPEKRTVLVVGGSRGARPINEAVTEALPDCAGRDWQMLYVTGEVHFDEVNQVVEEAGRPENVAVHPFLYNMPEVLAHVDVVCARAGATTLAELMALGLPAILIPSPYVTNNHQEKNARALEEAGAALVSREEEFNGKRLLEQVEQILNTPAIWERMHQNALDVAVTDANERLYELASALQANDKK
ncbi:UDP-N-acetylglucosamine-N-acetylmuramylpentapeptide N-acetylglucosamine transferase [Salsuginibacillus halophilus]|uniref:UDP-N-acetylglucosamine--N-acetylmuramyl-(pentapeptide) pyrophosphoryl-undecaprenol N-acetylglucosamine transferase n=1 Tax=Salsuginibacillus halophilus TaxID=517424 RepID=A0A2P8HX18_9BACI|nr:undecaprenyldiphospho-muramoylpentapeptide beta-N-acetylglucosaminyltransferase [Salsuginibacillus halophilus]PSL50770.1 UDP-N-acetylglucosamine-N-acetylmuramylpentapeptide N-acetylglucosamine transferase [Salsuginibacillus halophilus]